MTESIHFVGIGGTGLSAIARVLLERGEHVTGSDREDSALAQNLRAAGARITIGHDAKNINGAVRVIRSSAVGDDNVEVQAAHQKRIPVLKRAQFLNEILEDQQVIAVAGSHGKTTTSAMVAWILTALNQRPGFILGSVAANLGTNASAGKGRLFVIEADEYDYMFLGLDPEIALVTNVEHDHPDMFPTEAEFQNAFRQFVDRIKPEGKLIICMDDAGAVELMEYAKRKGKAILSYAHSHSVSDYHLEIKSQNGSENMFSVNRGKHVLAEVKLQLPGMHNALNALGALVVADTLGLNIREAALALGDFRGTERRFDVRGEAGGVVVVDDYAHHPTEIRATLAAARARFPQRRIWALWQPHTFSRTDTLRDDFAKAFSDADLILVTDVYAAREKEPKGFDISGFVKSIQHSNARFVPTFASAKALLADELKSGDVLIVMSAGDAINLSAEVFTDLLIKEKGNG
ncbi:MAG: UDP-N-acetylmuramate--L-alanine ligase [Anaerolineales bacterium]